MEILTTELFSNFPPYTILNFITISLSLRLGPKPLVSTISPNSSDLELERIPGTPLLSKTSSILGSLHPDNTSLLPEPGSVLELILITRSQMPTVGSALEGKEDPQRLFWCIYVVWIEGIAERRGVAQIMDTALEASIKEIEVKAVLLG